MEALGVESGSLLCRLARHFQTGVYIVAIVTAVSRPSVRYEYYFNVRSKTDGCGITSHMLLHF